MSEALYYAVKVNGSIVTQPFADRMSAENAKASVLQEAATNKATVGEVVVVPVTENGLEVLLG